MTITTLFFALSALAAGCEKPAEFSDNAKFDAQLKKQEYALVAVGEAKGDAAEGKDTEVEFESRGVVFSMGDIRDLVPKSPSDVVKIKARHEKGAPAIEKGKLYMVYLKKDKNEKYLLDACSHTHIAKGFMVNDVQAEQNAIHKSYGVNSIKVGSASFPDKNSPTPPLNGAPATPGGVPKKPLAALEKPGDAAAPAPAAKEKKSKKKNK